MKPIANNTNKGVLKHLALMLFLSLMAGACTSDEGKDPLLDDGGAITFTLQAPYPVTRSLTAGDENTVSEVDVLVFRQNGGTYHSKASVNASDITDVGGDSSKKKFTVTLSEGDYDLVIFANARSAINAMTPAGKTKTQVLAALTASLPAAGKWIADSGDPDYRPFPMWGNVGDISIGTGAGLTSDPVVITRMMARVDVEVSGAAMAEFQLSSVHVYNRNTEGLVAPASSAWDDIAKNTTTPTVPSSSVLTRGPVAYTVPASAQFAYTGEIYLLEAENHTGTGHTAPKGHLNRTCLVVGGIWDKTATGAFSGSPTYYRVDISEGTGAAETFLDVLRNHLYAINITAVKDKGYPTPDEAFEGDVRLTSVIENWDLAAQSVIGDKQYNLTLEGGDYHIFDRYNGEITLKVKTDYTVSDRGYPKGIYISGVIYNATPMSGAENITVVSVSGTDGAVTREFKIKTAAVSKTTFGLDRAQVRITAGNLTKVINIVHNYSITALFAKSNVVHDNGKLKFAGTEADNATIPANVQGVMFKWGSLVAVSCNGSSGLLYTSSHKVFAPSGVNPANWAAMPCFSYTDFGTSTHANTFDGFMYKYPNKGYNESAGKGDVCRYISDKGWVAGEWRMPTQFEIDALWAETSYRSGRAGTYHGLLHNLTQDAQNPDTSITVSGDGTSGKNGFVSFDSGALFGAGITATDAASIQTHIIKPVLGRMFVPASGYRGDSGNFVGPHWSGSVASVTPVYSSSHVNDCGSYALHLTWGSNFRLMMGNGAGNSVRCILKDY